MLTKKLRWLDQRPTFRMAMALGGLLLCLLAAIGPAQRESSVYLWPTGDTVVDGTTAGAELLLARHRPASVTIQLPCSTGDLDETDWIFKTAVQPREIGGLHIGLDDDALVIAIGQEEVLRSQAWLSIGQCTGSLNLDHTTWSLHRNGDEITSGSVANAPIVTSLIAPASLIDTGPSPLQVSIQTEVHGTSPTTSQMALMALGIASALVTTLSMFNRLDWRRTTNLKRTGRWVHRSEQSATAATTLVVSLVVILWVIAPTLDDDGWYVTAAMQGGPSGGAFRNYFRTFDSFLPIGLPYFFIVSVLSSLSFKLIWLRVLPVTCILGGWFLIRFLLQRLSSASTPSSIWSAAGLYATGSAAFLVTMRPEPLVALLTVGVLTCAIDFVDRDDVSVLAVGGILAAIAMGTHTTGIVAVAPLLAVMPRTLRQLASAPKSMHWNLACACSNAGIVLLVLLFVDSDLTTWLDNRDLISASQAGVSDFGWRDEFNRYAKLLGSWGSPERKITAFMGLLTTALLLFHRHESDDPRLGLPGRSLFLGFALLAFIPSKWPWHFGALVPLIALAFGTAVWRAERSRNKGDPVPAFALSAGSILVLLVAEPLWFSWLGSVWHWAAFATIWSVGWSASKGTLSSDRNLQQILGLGIAVALLILRPDLTIWIVALIAIAAVARVSLRSVGRMASGAGLAIPTAILVTSAVAVVIRMFQDNVYLPGGVGRVVNRIVRLPISSTSGLIATVLVLAAATAAVRPIRRQGLLRLCCAAVIPVVIIGMLMWDGLQTTAWSAARQNLSPFWEGGSCGKGDISRIVDPATALPVPVAANQPPAINGLPEELGSFALIPRFDKEPVLAQIKMAAVGGVTRTSIFSHAPGSFDLPDLSGQDGRLLFSYGIEGQPPFEDPDADGVNFVVRLHRESGGVEEVFRAMYKVEMDPDDASWQDGQIMIVNGNDPILRIEMVSEERRNQNHDWAVWSDISFMTASVRGVSSMTRATSPIPGAPIPADMAYSTDLELGEEDRTIWFATPWLTTPPNGKPSVFVELAGRFDAPNRLLIQGGERTDNGIVAISTEHVRVDHISDSWTVLELQPYPPPLFRLIGIDVTTEDDNWMAVSHPRAGVEAVTYQQLFGNSGGTTLSNPYIRLWFPCLKLQPPLVDGRVAAPAVMLSPLTNSDTATRFATDVYTYYLKNPGRFYRRVSDTGFVHVPWERSAIWSGG